PSALVTSGASPSTTTLQRCTVEPEQPSTSKTTGDGLMASSFVPEVVRKTIASPSRASLTGNSWGRPLTVTTGAGLPGRRGVLKAFGGFAGGDEHRVPDRRERRGVAEVEAGHLFARHLVPHGDGEGVDALTGVLAADDLGAEQPSGSTFDDELRSHAARPREVVGPGRGLHGHRFRLEAGGGRLRFPEAGAGDLEFADLGHGGPDHSREGGVATADVDADHPALLVGVGPEGDGHRTLRDAVERFDAVPGRPHTRDRRLHAPVGDDTAGRPDRDPGPP